MAIEKFVIPAEQTRGKLVLYAEPANINYFLKTPLTSTADAGVTNKQAAVKAHQRRQYPGDTSLINVPAAQREFMVNPARRSGAALPGRSIVLIGDKGLPGEEKRQFTLVGRWIDFHAWLSTKAKMEIYAYNNTGAYDVIPAAAAGP